MRAVGESQAFENYPVRAERALGPHLPHRLEPTMPSQGYHSSALNAHQHAGHDAPAFRWLTHPAGSISPLTHSQFVSAFKFLVSRAGLDWNQYSGHSFRRGGATFAFRIGVSAEVIKAQGDWKSEAYIRYIELDDSSRLALPQSMAAAFAES